MIIGNISEFAIESHISVALNHTGFLALGYFILHINGIVYGRSNPDALYIGTQLHSVGEIIEKRGLHIAPFSSHPNGGEIADAYRDAIYAPEQEGKFFLGMSHSRFVSCFRDSSSVWIAADQGFEDGSFVLLFDVNKRVRLIAFKNKDTGYHHNPSTLSDVWMDSQKFYGILEDWRNTFEKEWRGSLKES